MTILSFLFGKKKKNIQSDKLKLYSVRKVDTLEIFKIEKRQIFYKKFRQLLDRLGIKDTESWHYDPTFNREFPINKLNNFVDIFKGKNFEVDLIFTKDRVIILLRGSDLIRKNFIDELMSFCEWSETKRKIQPLRKNF